MPASATFRSSLRYSRKFRGLTGTGFAQPMPSRSTHQNAHGIQMLERIQRQAAHQPRRRVAAAVRDIRVRRFVAGNGEQTPRQRQQKKDQRAPRIRKQVFNIAKVHSIPILSAIQRRRAPILSGNASHEADLRLTPQARSSAQSWAAHPADCAAYWRNSTPAPV